MSVELSANRSSLLDFVVILCHNIERYVYNGISQNIMCCHLSHRAKKEPIIHDMRLEVSQIHVTRESCN